MLRLTPVAALLFVVLASPALVWAQLAFPELTGRVVDAAEMLSPAEEARLTERLAALEAATTDQLVVVTLPSLQGTTIEDYGFQLGRHWGIGRAEHDNGALLIVAPTERRVRVEVGYGLEGKLTDALSKNIIERAIVPAFRAGDMAAGIETGAAEIIAILRGEPTTLPGSGAGGDLEQASTLEIILIVVVFIGVFVIIIGSVMQNRTSVYIGVGRSRYYGRSSRDGFSGGGFSGGGFSGGGGGFGGGGASGGW